ncbi:MAG: hypothetical protein HZA54_01230 [Planctomycetes bacterium]|nr:hypothetical protein [Planctomycetota bacterium]
MPLACRLFAVLVLVALLAGTAAAEPAPLAPGQEVEVKYGANWLRGKIEKIDGDRVFVSWDGYDAGQNSWVTRAEVRPRPDPLAPAGGGAGAAGPDGGATQPAEFYQPGREVEIKYGANWLRGKIEKVEAERVFVSWDGYHESQNVWVPKSNVRPRGAQLGGDAGGAGGGGGGAPVRLAPPGKGGLAGIYIWTQVTPQNGTVIIRYLFRPDGTFVLGRAFAGGENLDWAAAAAIFPGEAGIYRIAGTALVMDYGDGRSLTRELEPGTEPARIKGWLRATPFPDGHRLDASYDASGGAAIAGATGSQEQRWVFHADGTFEIAEGRAADAGRGAAHAHTTEHLDWKGTYRLHGHTLTLTLGGTAKDYTTFLLGEELGPAPQMLFLDWAACRRSE